MRVRFDEFELDERDALLTRRGAPVALPPKAFGVLCALARQPGRLVRKDELLDAVWGHRHVSESVLKSTVSQLRAALGDDAGRPKFVETASRLGYRFIGLAQTTPELTSQATVASNGFRDEAPSEPESTTLVIGRRVALDRLKGAWARTCVGQHQLFWIGGDAGVGKTTLIETFIREAGPVVIAHGQCVEQYGSGEPYLPVLQGLGALVRAHAELPSLMRSIAPTWFLQMPWLASEADRATLSRELAGVNPERMVRELRELIERFTVDRPLLLVTEDLHWSDHATLQLMNHFARRQGSVGVLWIGSFRLTQVIAEGHPLQALRHELKLHRLCEEVLLDPFSEAEVGEYLQRRLPDEQVPEAVVRRLHRHTDGLPLFVTNLVESLMAQEQARSDDPWRDWLQATLPVPEDLAGTLEKQIQRLPEEARALLEAASVCGMEFQAATVASVLGVDVGVVTQRCDDLVRQQFWLRHEDVVDLPDGSLDTRYAFRHAIYRHVFYERTGLARRVQWHRRIAQALATARAAGMPLTPAELASHHELGREYAQALKCYAEAAGRALGQFAPLEAIELTARALALLPQCPEGPDRLELELSIVAHRGIACSHLKGLASPDAREAFERAREICTILPMTPQRALQLNGLGWMFHSRGEYDEASKLAESVRALGEQHGSPVLLLCAYTLLGMISATRGNHGPACDWLQKGIALCEKVDGRTPPGVFLIDPEVTLRSILAVPLMSRGLADQAREQARIAIERARRIGQPMARALSLRCAASLDVRLQAHESAAERIEALREIVESEMLAPPAGPTLWLRGWSEARFGDPAVGLKWILEGHQLHMRQDMHVLCTEAMLYAAEASLARQDLVGACDFLEQGMSWSRRLGEGLVLPDLLLLKARLALAEGDPTEARAALLESARVAQGREALGAELNAHIALAELPGHTDEDLDVLAATYARITEGFDIHACVRARALLDARLA